MLSLAQDDTSVRAQDGTNGLVRTKVLAEYGRFADIAKKLKYRQGTIDLRNGLATLNLPKEFNYLGPDDAETVLVKLWHNPPEEGKTLGLLIPAGMTPLSSNCWVVTIDYSEDGYVKDSDASNIDYGDLLKKMQKAVADENKDREAQQGYSTPSRWSVGPRRRVMTRPRTNFYWAKELKVDGCRNRKYAQLQHPHARAQRRAGIERHRGH